MSKRLTLGIISPKKLSGFDQIGNMRDFTLSPSQRLKLPPNDYN